MANGHRIKIISFALFLLPELVSCRYRNTTFLNGFDGYEDQDPIKLTRCDAICYTKGERERGKCHDECLRTKHVKLGDCPTRNLTVFEQACQSFCSDDSECPNVQKCCELNCQTGQILTCQTAVGLTDNPNNLLPPVPKDVTVIDKGKRRVTLSWKIPPTKDEVVYYVVQERHHQGRHFHEPRLGKWTTIYSTLNRTVMLENALKLVYWYQFRVAAVNEHGTMGYSEPSREFTLSCCRAGLIPKRPRKLRVQNIEEKNEKIYATIRWNRAKSEIPILRYKIQLTKKLDQKSNSTITYEYFVPKDKLWFPLKNLEKDTLYFIQVRAQGQYGKSLQNGREAQLIFNTTNFNDQYENTNMARKNRNKII